MAQHLWASGEHDRIPERICKPMRQHWQHPTFTARGTFTSLPPGNYALRFRLVSHFSYKHKAVTNSSLSQVVQRASFRKLILKAINSSMVNTHERAGTDRNSDDGSSKWQCHTARACLLTTTFNQHLGCQGRSHKTINSVQQHINYCSKFLVTKKWSHCSDQGILFTSILPN